MTHEHPRNRGEDRMPDITQVDEKLRKERIETEGDVARDRG